MQKTISDYLLSLGFIPNKCGYRYVFDLIYLATSGKEILPLKYVGYAEIAKKYKKTEICGSIKAKILFCSTWNKCP